MGDNDKVIDHFKVTPQNSVKYFLKRFLEHSFSFHHGETQKKKAKIINEVIIPYK